MTKMTVSQPLEEYGQAMTGIQKILALTSILIMYLGLFELVKLQAWPQLIGFIPLWFLITKFIGIPQIIALLRTRRHIRLIGLKRKLLIQLFWLYLVNLLLNKTGYIGYDLGAFFLIGGITAGFSMPMSHLLAETKQS
jgi:hypothetical protein